MADENDFAEYPKGQVAMGPGDLIDCTNCTLTLEDGEKIVATLRQNPAGSTHGTRSAKLECQEAISHAGFERAWFDKYDKREVQEFRFKFPGKTFVITGRLTSLKLESNVDDFSKFSFAVLGKYRAVS
jgi:hypothetical protein